MTIETPGLRERKRLATRRAIQLAVVHLTIEKGLDRVTVEDISARADISPRTFFNYFTSKEAAAVGDGPDLPADSELQEFVGAGPGSDLLRDLGRLLAKSVDAAADDLELSQARRGILKENPQLFAMRMATMRVFEDELAAVVARRMLADDPALESQPDVLADRARLVTLVAFGVMRHAWSCWADAERGPSLADRLRGSFDELERVLAGGSERMIG